MANEDTDDPGHPLYWQKFLSEAETPYQAEPVAPPSIDTLRQLYTSVLANYGYACAMTGAQFAPPPDFMHDELQLAAIRPLTSGGMLHVSNFLCLETAAADAFRQGHISVGKSYGLIVDLSRIDPELLERINPLGRLRLPASEIARPDEAALAYHRHNVFLGA